jgi:uncharacterized protein YutE (UPF0331/DUF86 family)
MKQEVVDKLEKLEEYITILRKLQQYSLEEIEKNYVVRGAVERYLQVSLEYMLDIGEIIISIEKINRPETYKEVFRTLGENDILPEALARKLEPVAGFRNVLVHMYAKIEMDKLYYNLQNGVEHMELFIEYIARFLDKK